MAGDEIRPWNGHAFVAYTTDWGRVSVDDLPDDLRDEMDEVIWTRSGRVDRRSKRSLQAWARLEEWMKARWMEALDG